MERGIVRDIDGVGGGGNRYKVWANNQWCDACDKEIKIWDGSGWRQVVSGASVYVDNVRYDIGCLPDITLSEDISNISVNDHFRNIADVSLGFTFTSDPGLSKSFTLRYEVICEDYFIDIPEDRGVFEFKFYNPDGSTNGEVSFYGEAGRSNIGTAYIKTHDYPASSSTIINLGTLVNMKAYNNFILNQEGTDVSFRVAVKAEIIIDGNVEIVKNFTVNSQT